MCGIAGIFRTSGDAVRKEQLVPMVERMRHRGPDGDGYFISDNVGLAMARLAIIDVASGKQPMCEEQGRYQLVFNGEIYNYIELRRDLETRGHRFKTNSDTEVIVHAYEEEGERCLDRLNGMFAFAIWDSKEKSLFVARDRLGIKPLFYYFEGGTFVFGSELKSLLVALPAAPAVDPDAFLLYLCLDYVPQPRSIFREIRKLEAGHFLKVDASGRLSTRRYWDVTSNPAAVSGTEEELLELLRSAMSLQMRSDVPIGTFLSGGLDSSCVVALLAEQIDGPVRTFSIGYEGATVDERPAARQVAQMYDCEHLEVLLTPEQVCRELSRVAWAADEPLADSAMVPALLLSEAARKAGVKVILNGTGGDEIFGGYPRYLPNQVGLRRRVVNLLGPAVRKELGRFAGLIPESFARRLQDPLFDYCTLVSGSQLNDPGLLRTGGWSARLIDLLHDSFDPFVRDRHWYSDPTQMMYFDLKTYLVGDLLALTDKMSMGVSLEGRVPLLDHRLVEWMFAVPEEKKLGGQRLKDLFRRTLRNHLPPEILHRRKMGFGGPVHHWMSHGLAEMMRQFLHEGLSPFLREQVDPTRLAALSSGSADRRDSQLLLNLTLFEAWYRSVVDGQEAIAA